MVDLTFYGGVEGEIGGNIILLEDKKADTRIFLDFGTNYKLRSEFFDDPFFLPKSLNDLLKIGAVPNLPIYRETPPENVNTNAVFISHAHTDHYRYVSTLNRSIPVYCSEISHAIINSFWDMKKSTFEDDFSGIVFKALKTGERVKINGIEVELISIDHSVPGACGFIIHTSEGPLAYTGDFRMHGLRANLTREFVDRLKEEEVKAVICEGTNLLDFHPTTEQEVANKISDIIERTKKLVLIDTSFVDVDRIAAIYEATRKTGRKFVLSGKQAYYLYKLGMPLKEDENIFVYIKQKKRYDKWEQNLQMLLLDKIVKKDEIHANPEKYVFVGSFYSLSELTEIEPPSASIYILSTSEPFSEEREMSYEKLINWLDYYGIPMYHTHASGHLGPLQLQEIMEEIKPEKVFSVHTAYPDLFLKFVSQFVGKVVLPQKGIKYKVF